MHDEVAIRWRHVGRRKGGTELARHIDARRLDVDPEQALRGSCRKFDRRFREVERRLADKGKLPGAASLDEMEAEWEWAKEQEQNMGDKP